MIDMIFRFDDICGNTNMAKVNDMADVIINKFSNAIIWFCISPLYHDLDRPDISEVNPSPIIPENQKEMVFPPILCALSDHRVFFKVDKCHVPDVIPPFIQRVSHGLLHIDHRLLPYAAQEMSIVTSASLIKTKIFVPPFNKWNKDTEAICREHNIDLVKFETGWRHMKHNKFNGECKKYYLHSCDFTLSAFKRWFK